MNELSDGVYTLGDHGGTTQIEHDDTIKKTTTILTRFGEPFGTLKFNEKSLFTHYWDSVRDGMQFMLTAQVSTIAKK